MSFVEYLAVVASALGRAEATGNYDEYLRLLGELEKAIAETRVKVARVIAETQR